MGEQRKLGLMEVLLAKAARRGGWRVGSMIDLEGPNTANVEVLRNTLKSLQERHEMLRMRVDVSKEDEISWHEDAEQPLSLAVRSGDKKEIFLDAQAQPMEDGDGVMRVVLVVNEGAPSTTLIVLIEHFASDGMSYGNILHEILLGMSGAEEFEEKLAEKLSIPEGLEKHGVRAYKGGFFSKLLSTYKLTRAMDKTKPLPLPPMELEQGGNPQLMEFFELTHDQSKKLLLECRRRGTTLTGLVGAVLAEAFAGCLYEREDGGAAKEYQVSQNLAYDLRRMYGPELGREHVSFQVGTSAPVVLKVTPESVDIETTWANAVGYKQQIKDHIEAQLPMVLPLVLAVLPTLHALGIPLKVFDLDELNSFDMFFTNWGRIPINMEYPGIHVLNFIGGINTTTLPFPVAILSSFRGKTGVTTLAAKNCFDSAFLTSLSNKIEERLQQVAAEC